MIEIALILTFAGLAIIVTSSIKYYKQIRKARNEYDKSKNIIENIVLSFNRELKRESKRTELVAYKVDGSISKIENSIKRVENLEKIINPLKIKLNNVDQSSFNFESKASLIESKIQKLDEANSSLINRIDKMEEKLTKLTEIPEIKSETVIPIRRERALSAVTETEIRVLELLSSEGGKTAPEIKNRINLSREHTARLMKKLYDNGYLERETGKIPFKYKIKEEMENILNSKK